MLREMNDVMTPTKLKIGILSSVVVIGLVTWLVRQQQSQNKLREKNRALQEQIDTFTQLAADNQTNSTAQSSSDAQVSELLRLRNEVGRLRQQSNELATLRAALATAKKIQSNKPESAATRAVPKEAWANVGMRRPKRPSKRFVSR